MPDAAHTSTTATTTAEGLFAVLERSVFGNTIQDYLIALVIFCGVVLGLGLLKIILVHRLSTLAKKTTSQVDDLLVSLISRHLGPIVYMLTAMYLSSRSLVFPEGLRQIINGAFVIILTVKTIQVVQALLAHFLTTWVRKREDSPTTTVMVKNMTIVLRLALWAGGLLFIFDNLGVDVTAFVAGLGIGGIAVALAAQAVLGDTFSSFAIFMDKPFEVGDFIIVGDFMGTVDYVGFKTTRLRSLGGEQLIMSNTDLTTSRVRNYRRMQERRVVFKLHLTYQTTYEQLRAIPGMIERIIKEHQLTRFDRAHFQSYGDFALIVEVVYYVLSPDYNQYMDVQQSINLRLFEEFEKAAIEFAHPPHPLYPSNVQQPT